MSVLVLVSQYLGDARISVEKMLQMNRNKAPSVSEESMIVSASLKYEKRLLREPLFISLF